MLKISSWLVIVSLTNIIFSVQHLGADLNLLIKTVCCFHLKIPRLDYNTWRSEALL